MKNLRSDGTDINPVGRDKDNKEKTEKQGESRETSDESKRLDQAVFNPEEVVEQEQDFQKAEAVEEAFVDSMDAGTEVEGKVGLPTSPRSEEGNFPEAGSDHEDETVETDIDTLALRVMSELWNEEDASLQEALDELKKMNAVKDAQRDFIPMMKEGKTKAEGEMQPPDDNILVQPSEVLDAGSEAEDLPVDVVNESDDADSTKNSDEKDD